MSKNEPEEVYWTPHALVLIGKVDDSEIAEMLGCDESVVAAKREEVDLPPPAIPNHKWNPKWNHLLGKMPDSEVARRTGMSWQAVADQRYKQGIESYTSRRRKQRENKSSRTRR